MDSMQLNFTLKSKTSDISRDHVGTFRCQQCSIKAVVQTTDIEQVPERHRTKIHTTRVP